MMKTPTEQEIKKAAEIHGKKSGSFYSEERDNIASDFESGANWAVRQFQPTEQGKELAEIGDALFWQNYDNRHFIMYDLIHNEARRMGWKEFYFAVLNYQAKMTKSNYRLLPGHENRPFPSKPDQNTALIHTLNHRIKDLDAACEGHKQIQDIHLALIGELVEALELSSPVTYSELITRAKLVTNQK